MKLTIATRNAARRRALNVLRVRKARSQWRKRNVLNSQAKPPARKIANRTNKICIISTVLSDDELEEDLFLRRRRTFHDPIVVHSDNAPDIPLAWAQVKSFLPNLGSSPGAFAFAARSGLESISRTRLFRCGEILWDFLPDFARRHPFGTAL